MSNINRERLKLKYIKAKEQKDKYFKNKVNTKKSVGKIHKNRVE